MEQEIEGCMLSLNAPLLVRPLVKAEIIRPITLKDIFPTPHLWSFPEINARKRERHGEGERKKKETETR